MTAPDIYARLREDLATEAKTSLAEIEALRKECERLTDLRVRDAAYSAAREKEARWILERCSFAPHWQDKWREIECRRDAWLKGEVKQ